MQTEWGSRAADAEPPASSVDLSWGGRRVKRAKKAAIADGVWSGRRRGGWEEEVSTSLGDSFLYHLGGTSRIR